MNIERLKSFMKEKEEFIINSLKEYLKQITPVITNPNLNVNELFTHQ